MGDSLVQQWAPRGVRTRTPERSRPWPAVEACPERALWPSPQSSWTPFSPVVAPFACACASVVREERDLRARGRGGEARGGRALRGPRRRVWAKMYKITALASPLLPFSTAVQATPSELPSLRRSSSRKRPDRRNPPAIAMLANTHTMSLETRKQHRHGARPSRIDPSLSRDGCTRALAVRSHLPRTATPTEGPICPENSGREARREDGVERHQAIHGHQPALLRRTPGNSRVPEAMVTSRTGSGDAKPAFWPSGVRCGILSCENSCDFRERAHQLDTKRGA